MSFRLVLLEGLLLCVCASIPRAQSSALQTPHTRGRSLPHTDAEEHSRSTRGAVAGLRAAATGGAELWALRRRSLQASDAAFPSNEPYAPCGVSGNYSVIGFQGALQAADGADGAQVSGTVTAYDDCYLAIQNLRCGRGAHHLPPHAAFALLDRLHSASLRCP